MTQNFQDQIATLCVNFFNSLPKTGKPTANEWTVLSCIIKENTDTRRFEVVSLGTGSKCIGKTKMSPVGDVLNDSHAETVCRRAFLRYIYSELNLNSEIFIFNRDSVKYVLRETISFHFFTSHVPCGDAAIFPKRDLSDFAGVLVQDSNSRRLKRKCSAEYDANSKNKLLKVDSADIFRTGAKCLPEETRQDLCLSGLQYHTVGAVRLKPGRGDPTLSVSCSDKIAKWCFMGVQGKLLSLLIEEPVYLSSFTVAGQTQYCENALNRALFGRFDSLELKVPYRLKKMTLGQASVGFEYSKNNTKQPCPSSIAWCKNNSRPLEVAVDGKKQGVTKKNRNTQAGRLQISKIELFRTFLRTVEEHNNLSLFNNKKLSKVPYDEAKAEANDYQETWDVVKCKGFKVWTVKDEELLKFVVD